MNDRMPKGRSVVQWFTQQMEEKLARFVDGTYTDEDILYDRLVSHDKILWAGFFIDCEKKTLRLVEIVRWVANGKVPVLGKKFMIVSVNRLHYEKNALGVMDLR